LQVSERDGTTAAPELGAPGTAARARPAAMRA